MYWYDVQEEYFNAYQDQMDPFYKDANGVIFDYDKVSMSQIYTEPFYMEEQRDRIAPDGRLLLLKNQEHWLNVQKQLRSLKWNGVHVSI